jgi:site-specific DNA-methyltransferase (adenine-specific)
MKKPETFLDGRVTLHCGDCLKVMAKLKEHSVDSAVCDPPYHLHSITKRFAKTGRTDKTRTTSGPHQRTARGFMNKLWDGGDVAFRSETWSEVHRVLKPGSYLLAMSGTRTYHRLATAIEDGGFIVYDMIAWAYGQGFPKSHNLDGEWDGWGSALKPALEPICLAQKPRDGTIAANIRKWGTGALNIDGCRVSVADGDERSGGFGLGKRPWQSGDVGGNTIRVGSERGRWPANIIHDGSEEVIAAFPDAPGQQRYVGPEHGDRPSRGIYGDFGARPPNEPRDDAGSAARFFYTAKADSDDRLGSKHPTVKPLDLMQYLVRLVTPPRGLVLDPFAGTGTTGDAAWREGLHAVLIEREPEYQTDIRRRMKLALAGPDERARESIKEKLKDKPADHGPLFAELLTGRSNGQ